MRSLFLLLIVMLSAAFARAEEIHIELYPLAANVRYERDENQNYGQRTPTDIAGALSMGNWALLAEFTHSQEKTGNSYSEIDHTHQEELLWIRRDFTVGSTFFYGGSAGLGVMQDSVDSRIATTGVSDTSGSEMIEAVGLETGVLIEKTLRLSLEGRLFFGSNLDPSPQPDLALRLGLVF